MIVRRACSRRGEVWSERTLEAMSGHPYDVAVIGGGMAGIAGALTAVRKGAKVALFEPAALGGT